MEVAIIRLMTYKSRLISVLLAVLVWVPAPAFAQTLQGVVTYHNDALRTGQNVDETALTPLNVNSTQFGKLFTYSLDGFAYTQPLYVPHLNINNKGFHNVVFVATEHDSVYAFDADKPGKGKPLWKRSFLKQTIRKTITSVPYTLLNCTDIVPEIGITGTPVIDLSSGTLYVVAETLQKGNVVMRIHALNIHNGSDRIKGGQVIDSSITVPGTGGAGDGVVVPFNPLLANQRSALLLANGVVYAAFASHCDIGPYTGWVIGFDAKTLKVVSAFASTPDGSASDDFGPEGGIWMAGGGPAVDANGGIFVSTGNGTFDADSGGRDYGDSFIKLGLSGGNLAGLDFFTPYNESFLSHYDLDLGSGGMLLLPDQPGAHPHELISGGKQGTLYLVDRDNMGGFNSSPTATNDPNIVQEISGLGPIFGTPSYFNNDVYLATFKSGGQGGQLVSFGLQNDGTLSTSPVSSTDITNFSFPPPTTSISSNGTSDGIVWALRNESYGPPESATAGPATLYAFDANDLSTELYDSDQAGSRDQPGDAVKFTVPTIANGKVYVGGQYALTVYGLLP